MCIAAIGSTCASQHNEHTHQLAHTQKHQKRKHGEITKLVTSRQGITCEISRRRGVCSLTRHTLATMSEGASAESTAASQASTGGSSSADPLAAGEAIDEMLAANYPPKLHKKRKYPEPNFAIERFRAVGRKGSYPTRFKLKAVAFTRVLCVDGQPVGNAGAAKVLGVDRKRIIVWLRDEE